MILKPSEINVSTITHARNALLEVLVILSSCHFVFEDQFSRLLKFVLYLHRYVAHLKHSYF